jgi:glycosyltransferase involved in cell wall biosynthesis
MLTILIPAYNEERRIAPALSALCAWAKNRGKVRVLVVSDGNDGTAAVCKRFAAKSRFPVKVISFPRRIGKGAAVLAGLKESKGDVLSFDADASLELSQISRMQRVLAKADIAVASRRSSRSVAVRRAPLYRRVLSFLFNSCVRLLFGLPYSDTQCGYKLYSRRAVRKLSSFGFSSGGYEWDVEMLLAAEKLGLVVAECPVRWAYRQGGKARPLDLLWMTLGLLRLWTRYALSPGRARGRGPSSRTLRTKAQPQS